jgi:YebC/PmpR family DNA-binding regulatory protein
MNPRLRTIIAEAKSVNMPADNIKRAIQRGTGELPGVNYDEITYEAYGPGGVAIIIETLTDNKNRTVGEMRHTLTKWSGNLGEANSVAWMFEKKGYIVIEKSKADEEKLLAAVIDAGADDMQDDDTNWEVVSPPETYTPVLEAVKALGIEPAAAEIALLPKNYIKLEGKAAQQMIRLMEALEENEDTKKVWTNADIEEKEIEASLA